MEVLAKLLHDFESDLKRLPNLETAADKWRPCRCGDEVLG